MQFPRWYARWNRLATNKLVRLWAGWVPAMAVLTHRGRRSGKLYRTPLNVFPTDDGWAVFLPYGVDKTEWLKNVKAAGGARMQHYGRTFEVSQPRVTSKTDAAQHVLRRWLPVYRRSPFPAALLLTQAN
jgi:deazaflavin-dependent oxidoreductase (nitroreductase family)